MADDMDISDEEKQVKEDIPSRRPPRTKRKRSSSEHKRGKNDSSDSSDDEAGSSGTSLGLSSKKVSELAQRAGYNPHEMQDEEKEFFPEYVTAEPYYLDIRNTILALWKKETPKYLPKEKAAEFSQPEFREDVYRIHDYLQRVGDINVGIFDDDHLKKIESSAISSTKILIIGAGAAGLVAGRQLHQMGYNVTILEARDRIGGRVNTDETRLNGARVDLGASIITGLIGNPLDNPHSQLKLRTKPIGENTVFFRRIDGSIIDEAVEREMGDIFNEMLDRVIKLKSTAYDKSLGAELDTLIPKNVKQEDRAILDWYYANLEYACAADLSLLSVNHWDQDDPYDYEGEHLMLCDGYIEMIRPLAQGLDIRLNHVVTDIEYNDKGVTLSTNDRQKFEADAVLVTLPLGVLKDDWVKFSPELPPWKKQSIKALGYGLLNKVVLMFDKSFWKDSLDWFSCVNADQPRPNRGNYYLFWNMQKYTGQPILTALVTGEASHQLEKKDDAKIVDEAFQLLLRCWKPQDPPKLLSSIVTRWETEKYSRGSYSYVAIDSSGADYDQLAKPLADRFGINRIYFGGEATNKFHPATVAGAYQSGLREATLIHKAFYPPSGSRYDTALANKTVDSELDARRRRNASMLRSETEAKRQAGFIKKRGLRKIGSGNVNHIFKYVSLFNRSEEKPTLFSSSDSGNGAQPQVKSDYVNYNSLLTYVLRKNGTAEVDAARRPKKDATPEKLPPRRYDGPRDPNYRDNRDWSNSRSFSRSGATDNGSSGGAISLIPGAKRQKTEETSEATTLAPFAAVSTETQAPALTMRPPTPDYSTEHEPRPAKVDKNKKKPAAISTEKKKQLRNEIGQLVVDTLSKYHKAGQIDKTNFKEICRTITHEISEKEAKKGSGSLSDSAKEKAKAFAKQYFKKKAAQIKKDEAPTTDS